ncbi:MAG TPA: sulfatase-like hydrolase/transferase [Polyangiaceae bacterium]|nr:sulfatase-like hydrolase/transferase [Polyangiaceae bacterium]
MTRDERVRRLVAPRLQRGVPPRLAEGAGATLLLSGLNFAAGSLLAVWQGRVLLPRVFGAPTMANLCDYLVYSLGVVGALALGLLAFAVAIGSWVPPRVVVTVAGLVFACFIVEGVLDAKVFLWVGCHVYSAAVLDTLRRPGVLDVIHTTWAEVITLVVGVALVAATEIAAGRACLRFWDSFDRARPRAVGVTLGVLCLATGGTAIAGACRPIRDDAPLAEILPFYGPFFAKARSKVPFVSAIPRLDYPKRRAPVPTLQRRPNVLFVVVESLRYDVLADGLTPSLQAFADRHHCIRSRHHYSASHVTEFAFFSLLYGVDAYYYKEFVYHDARSYPLEVFRDNDYVVAGGCSAQMSGWGYAGMVTRQLSPYVEPTGHDPSERDAALLEWARGTYLGRSQDRPLFLFLFFDSTHHNYSYPPSFERFLPVAPEDANHLFADETDPVLRAGIRNRYKNAVLYVDSLLGRLLEAVEDDLRRGNLLVVVTGDHGEEFWDDGTHWGHMEPRYVNERTEVPFVMCTPDGRRPDVPLSGHSDVMPTILDDLGLAPSVEDRDYSDGVSLLRDSDPDRHLVISSLVGARPGRAFDLVTQRHKFWIVRDAVDGQPPSPSVHAVSDLEDREVDRTAEVDAELKRHLAKFELDYGRFYLP